jgi:predicted transcriptional regulator
MVNVRLPGALLGRIDRLAVESSTTRAAMIRALLDEALKRRRA